MSIPACCCSLGNVPHAVNWEWKSPMGTYSEGHRRSQDFVWGCTFLYQKSTYLFLVVTVSYVVICIICCHELPHLPSAGVRKTNSAPFLRLILTKMPEKNFFRRPGGCTCTPCTPWLRLWWRENARIPAYHCYLLWRYCEYCRQGFCRQQCLRDCIPSAWFHSLLCPRLPSSRSSPTRVSDISCFDDWSSQVCRNDFLLLMWK